MNTREITYESNMSQLRETFWLRYLHRSLSEMFHILPVRYSGRRCNGYLNQRNWFWTRRGFLYRGDRGLFWIHFCHGRKGRSCNSHCRPDCPKRLPDLSFQDQSHTYHCFTNCHCTCICSAIFQHELSHTFKRKTIQSVWNHFPYSCKYRRNNLISHR